MAKANNPAERRKQGTESSAPSAYGREPGAANRCLPIRQVPHERARLHDVNARDSVVRPLHPNIAIPVTR